MFVFADVIEHFNVLQAAGNATALHVNAQGPTVVARVENISTCVNEVVMHGVRQGATVALATALVHTGEDLSMLNFALPFDKESVDDLVDSFVPMVELIAQRVDPADVVNHVFIE